jgi:hypothetical protein
MKEIQEELTRLGFNFYVIDPLLNDYVNTAIAHQLSMKEVEFNCFSFKRKL